MPLPPSSARLDADTFEFHRHRVRGMLVAVLGDEHAADDILQDVWVRGHGLGPREPGALGAWLMTFARRLALNERRACSRRRGREEAAARAEALPSTAAIAAQVDAHRRVLDVLAGLDERHRSLLESRYFAGLGPMEIAARDSLSVHTVKDRLRRAREALRQELQDVGADGEHRALAVLPWLNGFKHKTFAVATGWMTMKATFILAATILVAVSLFLFWSGGAGEAVEPGNLDAATPHELVLIDKGGEGIASLDPAPVERHALQEDAAPEVSEVSVAPWVIEGYLRDNGDPDGLYPSNSYVDIAIYVGYGTDGELLEEHALLTTVDGTFSLERAAPKRTVTVVAAARPIRGFSHSPSQPALAIVGEGSPNKLWIRFQRSEHWIEGTVRAKATGAPVAGAEVRFNSISTETDADGVYHLHVPSTGYGGVKVTAEGFRTTWANPGVRARGQRQVIDLFLEEPSKKTIRVFGAVRDVDGAPVPGAAVRIWSRELSTVTDSSGLYEFERVRLAEEVHSFDVTASAEGFPEKALYIAPGGQSGSSLRLDFELHRGVVVKGIVTDTGGKPVRGARLWLGQSSSLVATPRTWSEDDGSYRFTGIPVGSAMLGASKGGFAGVEIKLQVEPRTNVPMAVDIKLEPEVLLRGVVLDHEDAPVPGARIAAFVDAFDGSGANAVTSTNDDGQFELHELGDVDITLRISGDGLATSSKTVPAGTRDVVLRAARAVRLFGHVTDASTGRPVDQFKIRFVMPANAESWFDGIEDSWIFGGYSFGSGDGAWTTGDNDPICAGVRTGIEITAEGYQKLLIEDFVVPEASQSREIAAELTPIR